MKGEKAITIFRCLLSQLKKLKLKFWKWQMKQNNPSFPKIPLTQNHKKLPKSFLSPCLLNNVFSRVFDAFASLHEWYNPFRFRKTKHDAEIKFVFQITYIAYLIFVPPTFNFTSIFVPFTFNNTYVKHKSTWLRLLVVKPGFTCYS